MKSKVRLLNLVVSSTLILLAVGAVLVVLGIFNEGLRWDIFGPKVQAVLYGVFGSCMALAGFGAAMTLIIAIQESVKDFKKFVQSRTNQEETPDATKRAYLEAMLYVVLLMGLLVGICALANHFVLTQRCKVFKRLAGEQFTNFQGNIVANVDKLPAPPISSVPSDLYDLLKSFDDLDFVNQLSLYVPDPKEVSVMWNYTSRGNSPTNTGSFNRFYIAKDFEKAMRKALDGNATELEQINSRNEFILYRVLSDGDKKPKGVLRIEGNSGLSFREYSLGS